MEYCDQCFHPEDHKDDPHATQATPPFHEFQFFDDGTPILPPLEDFRHGKDINTVMHTYLSLHWGENASLL